MLREYLKEAAVKDAFVVAYRKTTKQNIAEAIKNNRELEKRIQAEGRNGLIRKFNIMLNWLLQKHF